MCQRKSGTGPGPGDKRFEQGCLGTSKPGGGRWAPSLGPRTRNKFAQLMKSPSPLSGGWQGSASKVRAVKRSDEGIDPAGHQALAHRTPLQVIHGVKQVTGIKANRSASS